MKLAHSALLLLVCLSGIYIAPASADQECTKTPADIAVLLDSSNSINNIGFGRALNFSCNLVTALGTDTYRFAYATFSTSYVKYADFNTCSTVDALKQIILNTQQLKQNTDTANAFRRQISSGTFLAQNGRRSIYPCYTVVITDGRPDDEADAVSAANDFEAQTGCKRILLGIGSAKKDVLISLASGIKYVFYVNSFGSIDSLKDLIVQLICKDTQTPAPPLPPPTAAPQPAPEPPKTTEAPAPPPPTQTTAPATLPPVTPCSPTYDCLNFILVIDGSSSITLERFQFNIVFALRVIDGLSGDKISFAAITYGTHNYTVCPLTSNRTLVREKISSMGYRNSSTHTSLAIDNAIYWAGTNPGCKTIITVVTDGLSTYPNETKASAARAKELGYTLAAVGVGQADKKELTDIASPGLVLTCNSYDVLAPLADEITRKSCEPPPLPPVPPCTPAYDSLNVIFVVDGSSSIGPSNFRENIVFIIRVINALLGNYINFGAVTYGTHNYTVSTLTKDRDLIKDRVQNMQYRNSTTRTDLAIDNAVYIAGTNRSSKTIIIVITDGLSTDSEKTKASAAIAKNLGFDIVAIGVTADANKAELNDIASNGYVYTIASYTQLALLAETISKRTCAV